jgi:hypothetical protein
LARVRRCLLTPENKAAYDRQLKTQGAAASESVDIPVILPVAPSSSSTDAHFPALLQNTKLPAGETVKVGSASSLKGIRSKRDRSPFLLSMFGWITGGLAALGVGAWLVGSGLIGDQGVPEQDKIASQASNSPEPGSNSTPAGTAADNPSKGPASGNGIRTEPPADPGNPPRVAQPETGDTTIAPNNKATGLKGGKGEPRATAPTMALISSVKAALAAGKILEWELSSDQGSRQAFRLVPRQGALLIGFAVSESSEKTIQAITPIYFSERGAFNGRSIGGPVLAPKTMVARPGYAVGEIEVSSHRADELSAADVHEGQVERLRSNGPL